MFSHDEKVDMYSVYIQCRRNSVAARQMYINLYPERQHPHKTLFQKLARNLRNFESLRKKCSKRRRLRNEIDVINVIGLVEGDPQISTRNISEQLDIPQCTVHRIIKSHKFHPYKVHISQALQPGDQERRMRFCQWYINQCDLDNTFPMKVLWSDESRFTNCGVFNRANYHHYAQENPRCNRPVRKQIRFGINVWCGILGNRIIGPYVFQENLNGERYVEFLQNTFAGYLEDLPLAILRNCHFQQDGAPPHNIRAVKNFLNHQFAERWIGNGGPVEWPARSPDLSPLDFFLWGYVKNSVYTRTYNNQQDLIQSVVNTIANINGEILRNSVLQTSARARACLDNNGLQFEHLL